MQGVYYTDKNYIYESSVKSILSIRYATDGFSFCVHDENDRLVVFAHQPFQVDSLDAVLARVENYIVNDRILNSNFKQVYVIPCCKAKSLIPADFFQKDKLNLLYHLQQETDSEEELLYHHIEDINAYLVESIPYKFHQFLQEHYPTVQIVNNAFNLIEQASTKTLRQMEQLFVDIQDRYFDILLFRNAKLLLFNSFHYQYPADIVYFILNTLRESGTEKDKIHLFISGIPVKDQKFIGMLESYIPHIYYPQEPLLNTLLQDKEFNSSYFIHLLNFHRCGL
ncbi:DUF3822 family protein [uncultured Sanguibacteroides sp.]|uniref:DUF3822 family protein n=1 Tax=uncultured Sanguibacteroides sp. TaxID=1635151 RepID=UPI0025CF3DB2|nr:DUF3822 family protein [uncultured Sanguibacteroides sp.]